MNAERTSGTGLRLRLCMLAAMTCLGVAGLSSRAAAQKVIMLPEAAGQGGDAVTNLANSAMRDALGMQGLRVVGWDEAKARLAAGEKCEDVAACTPKVMKAASAELAAGVVVSRNAQGAAERVRVALLDTDKRRYDGESEVQDGDVRTATTRALLEARSFQLLGPGPWLRVEGTPEGAEVLLDDRIVGRVPYRATVIPGSHKLRVREAGYTAFEQQLNIPATDDSHVAQIVVALEPAPISLGNGGDGLRAVSQDNSGGHKPNNTWLVGPIVAGGLGLVLAGVTSVRLATRLDTCVNPDANMVCTYHRRVNVAPAVIEYSLSAALIGGSIAWIVIGLSDTDERQPGVNARLGLDGIQLAGRF
jgi:hypothetical protein